MEEYEHSLTLDVDDGTIGLGQRYVGAIDELLILDTALAVDDVVRLHALNEPVAELL